MMERSLMNRLMRGAMVSCAVSLVGAGFGLAQAPRYQSPIMAPAGPAIPAMPTPPAITPNGTVVEDVVVRVNDQIISMSDVERSEEQLAAEEQQSQASPAEVAERQKNMLRDMIDQQLLLSKGKELGINPDAEVIRRLDEIRKQNHFDTMEDLEKAARAQGASFEDFKAGIRNSVITQQVVRDEVGRRLQPTQAQEQAYYDAHKQEFLQPEQVKLAEILVATPADATDAQVAAAQAKANDLAAKIKGGASFADVAKASSDGTTAAQGGELGEFKRGALAKVLEDQTFSLPVGGTTAPIRTRQGFVILKVLAHQQAGIPPMKDVEGELQQAVYQEQMQPALRAYLTKLREEAYVDIRPGFVDSGASPKQTKPIFSAYIPPVPKKKNTVAKQRYDGQFRAANVGANKADSDGSAAPSLTAPKAAAPVASGIAPAGSAATSVAPATTAAPANTMGRLARVSTTKKVKEKKIHREKIRFGQAPRNALPPGPVEVAADPGPGGRPGNAVGGIPATGVNPRVNAEDPLATVAAPKKKTRFSDRAEEFSLHKKQVKAAKVREKIVAAPSPMTAEEKANQKVQSAPNGLNGDTTPKKKKKKKGDSKERLAEKPVEKTDKFANPTGPGTTNDLSKTPVAGAPAPTSNKTVLPPANAPAPGGGGTSDNPGGPPPATNGPTPPNTPPTQ
jgi:peptidyl-prolyl cis-trans isomerase SurA